MYKQKQSGNLLIKICCVLLTIPFIGMSFVWSIARFCKKPYESQAALWSDVTPYFNGPPHLVNWGNNKISLDRAWTLTKSAPDVLVGVIDSGIDINNNELSGQVNTSLSKGFAGSDPFIDNIDHGTCMAGIIAAKGYKSERYLSHGVCESVQLVSLKIFDGDGHMWPGKVAAAINYATENNIPILNISLGNLADDDSLIQAITRYPGLIVTGAGNSGENIDEQPVYLPSYDYNNIIVAGASTKNDTILTEIEPSNYGPESVDLFAPGEEIAAVATGFYGHCYGSSCSAAFVSGVAALVLSRYPDMNTAHLKKTIMKTVDKIDALSDKCVTGGRLNAYEALYYGDPHSYIFTPYPKQRLYYHWATCKTCGYRELQQHNWFLNMGVSECACGVTATTTPGLMGIDLPNQYDIL